LEKERERRKEIWSKGRGGRDRGCDIVELLEKEDQEDGWKIGGGWEKRIIRNGEGKIGKKGKNGNSLIAIIERQEGKNGKKEGKIDKYSGELLNRQDGKELRKEGRWIEQQIDEVGKNILGLDGGRRLTKKLGNGLAVIERRIEDGAGLYLWNQKHMIKHRIIINESRHKEEVGGLDVHYRKTSKQDTTPSGLPGLVYGGEYCNIYGTLGRKGMWVNHVDPIDHIDHIDQVNQVLNVNVDTLKEKGVLLETGKIEISGIEEYKTSKTKGIGEVRHSTILLSLSLEEKRFPFVL